MEFRFHDDHAFSYEILRAVAYTPYDGADLGEVLATTAVIRAGDWDSWYERWHALAARTEETAERAAKAGHRESARSAYLRASNYYRTAEFYLRDDPAGDPRVLPVFERGVDCFRRALDSSALNWRRVRIPYEGVELEGYYLQAGGDEPRPTLLAHGGFDSTVEEMYFSAGAAALRRGWNCLLFEGPGQGAAVRRHGLRFRPDWEAVVTPVVDHALTLPGVDPDRIALLGMSLGGYLAPRAAAFEHRLAACVAFDGIHDLGGVAQGLAPAAGAQPSSDQRWLLANARWTLGTSDWDELAAVFAEYDLTGIAPAITCPTLVCDAESDKFFPSSQPRQLHDELTCEKELISFTADEGADEHCHMGALTLFHQRAFDWLDEVVAGR